MSSSRSAANTNKKTKTQSTLRAGSSQQDKSKPPKLSLNSQIRLDYLAKPHPWKVTPKYDPNSLEASMEKPPKLFKNVHRNWRLERLAQPSPYKMTAKFVNPEEQRGSYKSTKYYLPGQ